MAKYNLVRNGFKIFRYVGKQISKLTITRKLTVMRLILFSFKFNCRLQKLSFCSQTRGIKFHQYKLIGTFDIITLVITASLVLGPISGPSCSKRR